MAGGAVFRKNSLAFGRNGVCCLNIFNSIVSFTPTSREEKEPQQQYGRF
jgi:hypothetical protein